MSDIERLMLECRYILSLKKSFLEIAQHLKIDEKIVFNDINYQLPKYDQKLNERIKMELNNYYK